MKPFVRRRRLARGPAAVLRLAAFLAMWVSWACGAAAEIIPADRRVDWTPGVTVGVPGGIPTDRTHLIDVTQAPYNADKTGATDARGAIQAAINAASKGDVVYLPAGTYRVDGQINIGSARSHITIRGAGDATVIDSHSPSVVFSVGSGSSWKWDHPLVPITDGMAKGSTTLTVSDTSAFKVGQIIHITELNDPTLPVVHVKGFQRMRKQKTAVVSKTATTVTIFPPLYWTLKSSLSPQIAVAADQLNGLGIEDLKINGKNGKAHTLIGLSQCYGCWIKNVHTALAANYHIGLSDSLHCEVRHCYIDELNHAGPNGAGLLMGASSACLVEDNIVFKCFPHLEINAGCSGNVFAYNFAENNFTFGIMGCAIDCNHGAHNSFDLYEGNIASVFQSDGYHGSASHITAFRNWFHGTCDTSEPKTDQFGRCVALNRFSRHFSIVGNILGRTGYTYLYDNADNGTGYADRYIYNLGLPNMGNGGFKGYAPPWKDSLSPTAPNGPGPSGYQELDRDVAATTIRKGNWNAKDGAVPPSESLGADTLPKSLFRATKPEWFGKLPWPPFDPANPNQSYEAIPAGCRYRRGTDPPL